MVLAAKAADSVTARCERGRVAPTCSCVRVSETVKKRLSAHQSKKRKRRKKRPCYCSWRRSGTRAEASGLRCRNFYHLVC
uniref:Uncharacterized protein n=1 Tax=Knipowitschia caucasica TaxID=637954 RepID=A0AAV2LXB6_KNICA